ncbi:MAG: hypothetical protein Q9208_004225 [Pyrenodesmia sp. 3 TL-2023]
MIRMSPPKSHSRWAQLPPEIWDMILSALPDLWTLLQLMEVFPYLTVFFTVRYREFLVDILSNSESFQISKLASYVLSVRNRTTPAHEPLHPDLTSKDILRSVLENEEQPLEIPILENPLAALEDLVTLFDDTDYWTDAFIHQRCCRPRSRNAAVQGPEQRASRTELYRIRRALWRIWALCEAANSTSDSGQPTINVYAINDFFEGLAAWELEEMECLYLFLRHEYSSLDMHATEKRIDRPVTNYDKGPLLRRLWSIMGYWLETHFTAALKSNAPWRILYYFAMVECRPTFYRPQKPLTVWSDAPSGANSPNAGWQFHTRDSLITPWPAFPTPFFISGTGFQEWGYCIWDQDRLDDWNMLERDGE